MPDGMYTVRGWKPLPFCEGESAGTARRPRLMLLWGGVCLAAALAGMMFSGLFASRKKV